MIRPADPYVDAEVDVAVVGAGLAGAATAWAASRQGLSVALLEQFEKIQNIQIERRDALLKELDKLQAWRAAGYPDQSACLTIKSIARLGLLRQVRQVSS